MANEQVLIADALKGLGYVLVDIEREGRGLLRVTIENVDYNNPINLTDCEKVTRHLNYSLPVENVSYERLEVSSPGLDRPVKTVADHIRFAGLEANVKLRVALAGRKNYVGILQGLVSGDANSVDAKLGLLFEAADGNEAMLEFTLAEVDKTRLVPVIDFKGRKS
jgi:ribosome maturation factor RimP